MKIKRLIVALIVGVFVSGVSAKPFYFCMASDAGYYKHLVNLIGSIHYHNFDQIGEIAVFDLGFTADQRKTLNTFAKVTVHDVATVHPDILKRFVARCGTRKVPGWYAWKPVVIKQALDMFPHVLYLDSGFAVLQPLDGLFAHIEKNGYCLAESIRSIKWMATAYVMNKFKLNQGGGKKLADKKGLLAGFVGVTHARYWDFIMPMYELARDLKNFAEDGSTKTARHDQPLFSIYAHNLGLEITKRDTKRFGPAGAQKSIKDLIDFDARFGRNATTMSKHVRYKDKKGT